MPSPQFNYIITIHNKEDLLERTLAGVAQCCSSSARIYPVLDGCTDGSERIVDKFARSSGLDVRKLHTPDVHELRTINAALSQITSGFTVVLQDDVALAEPDLEAKIVSLYEQAGPRLGVVSLRLAANVRRAPLWRQLRSRSARGEIQECDFVQRPDDYQSGPISGEWETFYPRMVAIKGPNIIPEAVRRKVGLLDERLAPYSYDDDDYCLRAMQAGFTNGLFPLRFESKPEWGGTRQDASFAARTVPIHRRNRRQIWAWHGQFISQCWRENRVPRGLETIPQREAA
jgi:GT2 family glycosyltransferase